MMNHLRLSGPYARLLLLWIMGRISHFTLWNLLMNIPIRNPHPSTGNNTVIVNPQELLGCTFLMDTQEGCIVECISIHESNIHCSDDHVKF
jgi:hypothetical protein